MPRKNDHRLGLHDNLSGQGLLLTTLALLAVGAVLVPSAVATVSQPGALLERTSVRHLIFVVLAALVLLTAWRMDYRWLACRGRLPVLPTVLLGASLISGVLVFVPPFGRAVGGYYRWLCIGPVRFQPSEMIKVAVVIFLASWLTRPGADARSFRRTFVPAVVVVGLCLALIVTQDFGTAVVIALASGVVMLLAGVRWQHLAGLAVAGVGAFYALLRISPDKWQRIDAMIHPDNVANPCTYQLRQSLLTIASGGWFGQGLGEGMMKRGFLPEDSTDFLFAVLCEEAGLVAGLALLAGLGVWLLLARCAAARAEDRFGRVLAGSLGALVVLQGAMHVAVNVGFLPPTGIAMPLVSAGGTGLLLMAAATALIVSVSSRPGEDWRSREATTAGGVALQG